VHGIERKLHVKITVDVPVSKLAEQRIKHLKAEIYQLRRQLEETERILKRTERDALSEYFSASATPAESEINRAWNPEPLANPL